MRVKSLVEHLAKKHNFNLKFPGRALWVANPGSGDAPIGDLVVCVCPQKPRYVIGRALPDRPGFSVYYSPNWEPERAFSDEGCPIKDLTRADEQMEELVEYFLPSAEAQVTELVSEIWWEEWFDAVEH